MKKNIFFRIMASSSVGTILEWYDFSLFAFLTPVLAIHFFPHEDKFTSLMLTYAIFAVGFFVRPIGAAIFGHLGDRVGRKKALIFSIVAMAIATCLIGLLPTYQQIGIFAPILLIILRLFQGLSAGGESTGAILFVMEAGEYKRKGFIGALLWAFVGVGMLLGSWAAIIVVAYPQYAWLWRVPFLLGIFTGIIGYFVRKRTQESLQFQMALVKKELVKFPLHHGVRKYKMAMLRIIGLYVLSAMITYLVFVFMPTYAANTVGLNLSHVTFICTLALTCVTFLVPLGGYFSDLVGRKLVLRWAAIGFILFSYPLFKLISQGSLQGFVLAESCFVLLAICFQGTLSAAVIEQVPTVVRYSVVAVGYNIAYSLFGGTAPLVASFIVKVTHDKAAPGFYLMIGAVFALLATVKMREVNF